MADDASDDRDDSDIELDVPEWGSSSDEEGGCLPYSDDIDPNGETPGADGPLRVAAGVSSGARNTALEWRGVVVAVGVHGEPSIRERDVLEARVRQVGYSPFPQCPPLSEPKCKSVYLSFQGLMYNLIIYESESCLIFYMIFCDVHLIVRLSPPVILFLISVLLLFHCR